MAVILTVMALTLGLVLDTCAGEGGDPLAGATGEGRSPGQGAIEGGDLDYGYVGGPSVSRGEQSEGDEILRFVWAGEAGTPASQLRVDGWSDAGIRFQAETDADGAVTLPGHNEGMLLFFGGSDSAADGILRVRVTPGRVSEVSVFRRGGVRVSVRDGSGDAVPGVGVSLAFPIEGRDGELYVPVRDVGRDQGLEFQRLVARIGAAGGELGPSPTSADIDACLAQMNRTQRATLVRALTQESFQSAWIGFPFLGEVRAVTDENGEHEWQGVPAGIECRVILQSSGILVTHPQADDPHANSQMRNEPGRPANFSAVFPVHVNDVAEVMCLSISDSVVTGRLPVRGIVANSAEVRLWSVSKGFLGESDGSSSIGVDWVFQMDETGAFSSEPYSPLPGDKMVTATWYPKEGRAVVASRTFELSANEAKDLGALAASGATPVEFHVVPVDSNGEELDATTRPGLEEVLDRLTLNVRVATVIDSVEGRRGVPPSFFVMSECQPLSVSGLPPGRLRVFVDAEVGEDSAGIDLSWRIGEVADLLPGWESGSKSVRIPIVFDLKSKREVSITLNALGVSVFAEESEVVLFRDGAVVSRGTARTSGGQTAEARLTVAVDPGTYSVLVWPSGLGAGSTDPSNLAGGVIHDVALGIDDRGVTLRVPRGRQVSGVLRNEDGSKPTVGATFALAPLLPGFTQPADSLRGRPTQSFRTLDADASFRLSGLPASIEFVGGGFNRLLYIPAGNRDAEGLQVRVSTK